MATSHWTLSISHYEQVTIRWAGRENTHIIRPGGQVEFIGTELQRTVRPDRAHDRSSCLDLVMKGLVRDGSEFFLEHLTRHLSNVYISKSARELLSD